MTVKSVFGLKSYEPKDQDVPDVIRDVWMYERSGEMHWPLIGKFTLDFGNFARISRELSPGEAVFFLDGRVATEMHGALRHDAEVYRNGAPPTDGNFCHHCLLDATGRHIDDRDPTRKQVLELAVYVVEPGNKMILVTEYDVGYQNFRKLVEPTGIELGRMTRAEFVEYADWAYAQK